MTAAFVWIKGPKHPEPQLWFTSSIDNPSYQRKQVQPDIAKVGDVIFRRDLDDRDRIVDIDEYARRFPAPVVEAGNG